MIDAISKKFAQTIYNNLEKQDPQQLEVMEYGFSVMFSEFIKILGMVLICYFFGILNYFFISFITIAPYKMFAGGVHANSHLQCFITSVIMFIGTIVIAIYLPVNTLVVALIYIFNLLIIYLYAPADVENNPKKNLKLRKTLRIISYITMTLISSIAMFVIKDVTVRSIMIYGLFITSILMTPIIYRFMKVKYGYRP